MIRQLAHICIRTRDLDETGRFYFEALGLKRGFDFVKDDKLFGYYVELGNSTFIEVFEGDPGEPGNIDHLAIQVDDLNEVARRLKAHGYETGKKTMGADHSWQAWIEDPNGVRIEFHEYTDRSLQLTGGTCNVNW